MAGGTHALGDNDKISFLAARAFDHGEYHYEVGDDFHKDQNADFDMLVRARYIIPVVDALEDKPGVPYHAEIMLREDAQELLSRAQVQIVLPAIVGGVAQEGIPAEGDAGEPPQEAQQAAAEVAEHVGEAVQSETFDPTAHTVQEVNDYLASHPDERDAVVEAEAAGKNRKGIVEGY